MYKGQYARHTHSPKCGSPRYKQVGKTKVHVKVVCHFPIIPRLKWMYRSTAMSKLLQWHATHKSVHGLVRHVVDNKAWARVDEKWANFAHDPRNLKLTISTNGFNPFSNKLWFTWLVYVLIYNLPPWLTTKCFLVLVSLIIMGKKSLCMNTTYVYLQPLVDELMTLWRLGVLALDYGKSEGSHGFILCALVLWTINDFLEYGLLSKCVHQGYVACPMCGPQTRS